MIMMISNINHFTFILSLHCTCALVIWTNTTFIRVIGSELVQKHVGKGACQLLRMAKGKVCFIFFDEIDATGRGSYRHSENARMVVSA